MPTTQPTPPATMPTSTKKRTIDQFFTPFTYPLSHSTTTSGASDDISALPQDLIQRLTSTPSTDAADSPNKIRRLNRTTTTSSVLSSSTHPSYPHPILDLHPSLAEAITHNKPAKPPAHRQDPRAKLDILSYTPWLARPLARQLFHHLRSSLPFYRVHYTIKRPGATGGPIPVLTPRYTTVFGLDSTSHFPPSSSSSSSSLTILDARSSTLLPPGEYTHPPRPLPSSLDLLRRAVQDATGETYNFCLVNYYATGADSIAWHSDDEAFLGREPAIASLSLGARRDFMLRQKPVKDNAGGGGGGGGEGDGKDKKKRTPAREPISLRLGSGDMVLMRGPTQANWQHSVPKRTGRAAIEADEGRINITFRKAINKAGTNNYYHYNVGKGPVYRWDSVARQMREWKADGDDVPEEETAKQDTAAGPRS